jgi:phosphoribosylaminoimidazolecarboxamide formyltransferase/IMP cyclohydrolase
VRPQRALLGVDDKRGLVDFARGLSRHGVELVATGGTERALREGGLDVTPIATVTGMEEMLDGRVKTLHPAIHAGILAKRELPEHMAALRRRGYGQIDMVVVNLYPFARTAATGRPLGEVVEAIDIGGPTLLRAAAKNWESVAAVSSPDQYDGVLAALDGGELTSSQLRQLALRVFELTAAYDAVIADYLRERDSAPAPGSGWPVHLVVEGQLQQPLRYGENPHQEGALYSLGPKPRGLAGARQLQGQALSYTNWLDADSAWRLARALPQPAAVLVKHTNPCGVALADTLAAAFQRAYDCDPRSAYGGIVGLNRPLDRETAEALGRHFLELVVAPGVTSEAVPLLSAKARLRVLLVGSEAGPLERELRTIDGGVLVQSPDPGDDQEASFTVVSKRTPTEREWADLRLAWRVAWAVKSNAIVLCRDAAAVGIGAGQMSRVEAVQLAVDRAGASAAGSCMASDAFFPMPDNLELAAGAGITAAIHPGGSVHDGDVLEVANRAGMALVTTGRRHFRH